jgi:hypothetical protein
MEQASLSSGYERRIGSAGETPQISASLDADLSYAGANPALSRQGCSQRIQSGVRGLCVPEASDSANASATEFI